MGLAESMSKSIGKYQRKDALKAKQKGRKKTKGPESILQDEMVKHFLSKGLMVTRYNSGSFFSEESGTFFRAYIVCNNGSSAGKSDLELALDGKVVYIEVKTGYNKQSDSQKKFQALCEKFNMPYKVAYSIEEAEQFAKKYINFN